jgi:hypothetical protein
MEMKWCRLLSASADPDRDRVGSHDLGVLATFRVGLVAHPLSARPDKLARANARRSR